MATTGESEPAAASEGADGTPPEPAAADAPVAPVAFTGPIKRGAALRRELCAKLPKLAVAGDGADGKRAMKVDPDAVDLDADAFIGPLHALVSEGRG